MRHLAPEGRLVQILVLGYQSQDQFSGAQTASHTRSRGFRFISIITSRQLTSDPPPPATPLFSSNPLSVLFCHTVSISRRAAKQFPKDSASLPTDDNRRMQKPASSLVAAKHPAIVNGKIKDRSKGEAPNIFKGKRKACVSVSSFTCTAGFGSQKEKNQGFIHKTFRPNPAFSRRGRA